MKFLGILIAQGNRRLLLVRNIGFLLAEGFSLNSGNNHIEVTIEGFIRKPNGPWSVSQG